MESIHPNTPKKSLTNSTAIGRPHEYQRFISLHISPGFGFSDADRDCDDSERGDGEGANIVNGYIKLWRKEQASEIWDQSPERYKLWHWILLNVNYKTATIERTSTQIVHALQFGRKVHQQTVRDSLVWLEDRGMITLETYGASRSRGYRIQVKNWVKYQGELLDESLTGNGRELDGKIADNTDTYTPSVDVSLTGSRRELDSSQEERRKKEQGIAHIAREDQVVHSVHPVEDFTPDPTFSPNALLSQWRTDGLPLPRSIHELEQENGLRRLHHDPPHWSTEEIRQALQILRDDFRSGNEQLRWVWKNGPGYLVKKKPDAPQVIEQVLEWKPFLSQQAQSTMFGNTKDDDTRTLTQRYLDERNG